MNIRNFIKSEYDKLKNCKNHGIKWSIFVDEHFYTCLKIEINNHKNGQITLTSPSGKICGEYKNGHVKIVDEPKKNAESGKYVLEIKNEKKIKKFNILLNGPSTKIEEIIPRWGRYESISAFFIFRGVRYILTNYGDLPIFFKSKSYDLPSGKLIIPEFFLLNKERKKIFCKSENCERIIIKNKRNYEKRLNSIAEKIEEMGRARFGLATSAL